MSEGKMNGPLWPRRRFLAGTGAVIAGSYLLDASFAAAASAASGAAGAAPPNPADESGYDLWLRYREVERPDQLRTYRRALTHVVVPGKPGQLEASAATELKNGLTGLLGQQVRDRAAPTGDGAVIIGTPDTSALIAENVGRSELDRLGPEGYVLRTRRVQGTNAILVASSGARGVLYGAFHLLRLVQTRQRIDQLDITERPANPLRLANHWDNLDRTVERGYAGPSIFHWDELPELRPRYTDYARALASVGVNGTVVNNVNASPDILSSERLPGLAALAGVLREWGVTFYLSANFASPMVLGGLDTADPLDPGVQAWWQDKIDEIYSHIPDFGGFLVKANSEGQPGPLEYGRTHADGANLFASALQAHDGIVMWRAFIHDGVPETWVHLAYETFKPLDGRFADNVVVQIKNGPQDFKPREPVHPLFGAMPNTNSMLELQVTQEYTGQSTHLCYLVPMWKEVYDFDTHANGAGTTVATIVDGSAHDYSHSGVAGVMNIGSDDNWTGHHLAAANTHGYARLAWNPALGTDELAEEWVRMTFGSNARVVKVLTSMLTSSWRIYENYTTVLGVAGYYDASNNFDPSPATGVGWHHSDAEGMGYDRTVATGAGYTAYYHEPVFEMFESLETCPEELLLFFHHVPYSYRLQTGKTVIQHIYDSHFEGLEDAERLRRLWRAFTPMVDERRHEETLERFDWQIDHATQWRDALVSYYFELTRILDEQRGWVQIKPPESTPLLLGGWPNLVQLSVGNASADEVAVTAGFEVPDGWSSGTGSVAVPSREFGVLEVPVTPPIAPQLRTLRADVDAGGLEVLGRSTEVVTAPAGQHCVLALDAGTASSPALASYTRLSPDDAWDASRGYGWVGDAPQSRIREGFDALRRDFVNDVVARTLRVAVPAGEHRAYLLVGDAFPSHPTRVSSNGEVLAESEYVEGGEFVWLEFVVDGGASGREIDLELSSVPDQHWHLNALAIVNPDAVTPAAALLDVSATTPLFGARPGTVTAQVMNLTDAAELSVTARVVAPDGWTVEDVTQAVAQGEVAEIALTVTPPAEPGAATLRVEVSADGYEAGDQRDLEVVTIPHGDDVALALDAGSGTSPVVDTYQRLSPGDAWDAARGYGWVGAAPQSRDRGGDLDALRRDFVNDAASRVLRVAVPAGQHDVFLLVGDPITTARPTYVRSGGSLVAESDALGTGEFAWLHFTLDGGSEGNAVDLELSGDAGEHWRLNALVVR